MSEESSRAHTVRPLASSKQAYAALIGRHAHFAPLHGGPPTTSVTRSSSVAPLGSATVDSQRTPPLESASAASLPPENPAYAVSPEMVTPFGLRTMSEAGARW